MTYSKNYCEEKGISTSELNEPQRTLYYIAENMKMDKSISEEGYRHFQIAIKALEQQPKPMEKFDDVKAHIQRLAGDYKCWDNRLTWEEALELNRMLEAQPSEDCISRQAVLDNAYAYGNGLEPEGYCVNVEDIRALPSVTPTNEDIKEAYLKGYDYGVKDWFKSKTQPYTDEEIDKAQAVEQAYVDKMVELAVEEAKRPKGKWIDVNDNGSHGWGAYKSHVCSECKDYYTTSAYEMKYCPNCGAEMEVEE